MDFSTAFKLCASGLAAQRVKMDIVSSNLANADTTKTPEGGPYRRKFAVLGTEPLPGDFSSSLRDVLQTVKVEEVTEDAAAGRTVYDPSHPDADDKGLVAMPNVNVIMEMADMIAAGRAYEACVTAFDASKNMALKTLELGK
jgi:flagellar basal-body rod protein FlgC